jgi:hypothetical protein
LFEETPPVTWGDETAPSILLSDLLSTSSGCARFPKQVYTSVLNKYEQQQHFDAAVSWTTIGELTKVKNDATR